jgi:hypothetical protein
MTKGLLAPFALALLSICLTACGGTGKHADSTSRVSSSAATGNTPVVAASGEAPNSHRLKGDEDDDDNFSNASSKTSYDSYDADADSDSKARESSKGYNDGDDSVIGNIGHASSPADKRTIAILVKRYYAAAATANGSRACSLMYSLYAEAIPEDYGKAAGPYYAHGNTCAAVMSKLFKHNHGTLDAAFQVTNVRISGNRAFALLGSTTLPARFMILRREHSTWKIDDLFGEQLP